VATLRAAAYVLAHAPDLVRYGSKPRRELAARGDPLWQQMRPHLRDFAAALAYPPNQVFLGARAPEDLARHATPWHAHPWPAAAAEAPFGLMIPQADLYLLLAAADPLRLLQFDGDWLAGTAAGPRLSLAADLLAPPRPEPAARIRAAVEAGQAIPLHDEDRLIGCCRHDHPADASLQGDVLLENLCAKATAALALRALVGRAAVRADTVDYVLSCSEEAVGDRYQRGGGNLAKAVAETAGCREAIGSDVKAFCAAPVYAIVHAACLIEAGLAGSVAVVGGASLAKLGMKMEGHLKHGMPILEDVLAGMAFLLGPDGPGHPRIRLDAVGRHPVSAGAGLQQVVEALVGRPLDVLGRKPTDIDKYAVELHNPEVTVPAGSGNVPHTNYKMIAALAVLRKAIGQGEMEAFIARHGLPGFAPTQGHIPAGVPFLGHALRRMRGSEMRSAMFVAKGSLFLGRMTQMADGMSFVLDA
jgi:betaine reductase